MKSFQFSIVIAAFLLSGAALADAGPRIAQLQPGKYLVKAGSDELCEEDLEVGPISGKEDSVLLGAKLAVNTSTTSKPTVTKSDLDPKCQFVEEIKRIDTKNKTIVSQVNKEVCGKKIRSEQLTRFTFTAGTIKLEQEEKGMSSSKCVWVKAKK